jgi:pyridoxal biosynthesis lyase PdxS
MTTKTTTCGCRVLHTGLKEPEHLIERCPLHEAAQDMAEALRRIVAGCVCLECQGKETWGTHVQARAALAKAQVT